jgi:succinate dehydrogenase/fumarate reductase flavoprotein subunit
MAVTVFLSVVFVTDGVIGGLRGRGDTAERDDHPERDDVEWVERFIDTRGSSR